MQYETLKHILKHGLLIEEDYNERYFKDWTKVSMKKLQEEFGDLNKHFDYLAEYEPDEY